MNTATSRNATNTSPAILPLAAVQRPEPAKFRGGGLLLLAIVGMGVVAWATPLAGEGWEFNRQAIANGEWSRLLTGHLVHWNFDHLLWDAATFLVLGVACLWRSVGRTAATLLAAAVAISGAIFFLQPEIETYRGLSGLDSALFTLLVASLWRESHRNGRRWLSVAAPLALATFLAKAAYETAAGATLFVDSGEAGFIPLASAHLIGGAVGAAIALLPANHSASAAHHA
ncbi:rhombosortase [Lacipirellula parvula]|uniref:Peptidase S54 rhomboid domain-containing protein n=1 Tax=Lacipirellula parvula TaxID=2650471 RepID=A0A5K7XGH0_9BACT|nr:rhombosortase [Lacipirellula parvula]BBO35984.1 hypothetical protein PLANPX_5596 [Lacipirellula parvula]